MPKLNQRGIAHIFLILFLLAGLAVAVYLVQQKTNILPKAYEPDNAAIDSTSPIVNRVFVTSTLYDGNLGGLAGADVKCQVSADGASLGGIWRAWLSDSKTSVASRLNHSNVQYQLLNGTVVANNWTDLTDGSINHAIDLSEYKSTVDAGNVWTNTTRAGEINKDVSIQPAHCQNWTDSKQETRGSIGSTWSGSTDYHWTESGFDYCINQSKRLFCFEQLASPSGLQVSVKSVKVNVKAGGDPVKAFDIFTTDASVEGFEIYGYPTTFGPGINFDVQSGGIGLGLTIPVKIYAVSSISTGIYSGTAVIRDIPFTKEIRIRVVVTVGEVPVPSGVDGGYENPGPRGESSLAPTQ